MSKEVEVVLKLKDEYSKELKGGASIAGGGLVALGKTAAAASAAVLAVGAASLAIGFSMASDMETIGQQFTPLLGAADAAQKRLGELSTFAANTPFALKEVAGASKTLETLTNGTLSTGDGLTLVGDAAAVAGVGFEELSVHVGRAYSNLNSNRAAGESISRMQELGLISGETRNKIEALQKAGKGKEAWELLQKELEKTSGAMDGLSNTFSGRLSTLKDNVGLAMADMVTKFGLFDVAKDSMKGITEAVATFSEKVDFTAIGLSVVGFANDVVNGFRAIIPNIAAVLVTFETLGKVLFNVGQIVIDSVIQTFKSAGGIIGAVSSAITKVITGDFSGAKDALAQGVADVGASVSEMAGKTIGNVTDIGNAIAGSKDSYLDYATSLVTASNTAAKGVNALGKAIKANADAEPGDADQASIDAARAKEAAKLAAKEAAEKAAAAEKSAAERIKINESIYQSLKADATAHKQIIMDSEAFELEQNKAKYDALALQAAGNATIMADITLAEETAKNDILNEYAEKRAEIKARQEEEESAANNRLLAEAERNAAREIAADKALARQKQNSLLDIGSSFVDMTSMMAKENKKYAVLAKITAHGQAAVNTAVGATKALELPYPMNLIAMGSVIAAGLVQQAKISQQTFAYGGIVQGTETSGDRIPVRANAREAILTTGDQREFLDIAHGKGTSSTGRGGYTYSPNLVITGDNDAPNVRRMLAESAEEFKSFVHTTMLQDSNVPTWRG